VITDFGGKGSPSSWPSDTYESEPIEVKKERKK